MQKLQDTAYASWQ